MDDFNDEAQRLDMEAFDAMMSGRWEAYDAMMGITDLDFERSVRSGRHYCKPWASPMKEAGLR